MHDLFTAFSHWPRRAQHAAIWLLLLLLLTPLLHQQPITPLQMQWQRLDEGSVPSSSTVPWRKG